MMFGVLKNNPRASMPLWLRLYSDQADEPTDEKIFDVWNCKMRS